jgi:hypothetical protein
MRKPTTTNAILLAIIGVLALALIARAPGAGAAWAQPGQPTNDPPFNAAEQRKQMLIALQQMNTRMQAIENKLNTGLNVKVTEMPPVVIKDSPKKDK